MRPSGEQPPEQPTPPPAGDPDRDSLDVADFELAAVRLLGADVHLYSDRVLSKVNVSPDLVAPQPL
ncbi:MAG: hypothetical protein ACRDQ9_04030 [Pseudonocardiaceae bacterium]